MQDTNGIVGRKEEIRLLDGCFNSGKAEMVIVYGRRRVGKTYLVKKLFGNSFAFYMTGLYKATKKRQLSNFAYSLSEFSGNDEPVPNNWVDAFRRLKDYLKSLTDPGRKVVFIDELPWLDNKRSDLLEAIDLFWNGWGNNRDDLMLILCGSATTWMTDKLLGDKGGMFNRDTLRLYLSPFTLGETELFLHQKGINASRYEIAEYYMVMGGIPYYLDKIQRGKSVAQNIDLLFFKRRGLLWDEFQHLYKTLFSGNQSYTDVVKLLSTKREGFTREEILQKLGIESGGDISKVLSDLCNCDFVTAYKQFGMNCNNLVYRLSDFYTLFYFRFLQDEVEENYWTHNIDNPERRAWSGYAFEEVCLWHLPQIKRALGIEGLSAQCSTLNKRKGIVHAQIDLIIKRRDDVLNLCEIKFAKEPYYLDSDYTADLLRKKEALAEIAESRQTIFLTMIAPFGLKNSSHNSIIDDCLTLDDLF